MVTGHCSSCAAEIPAPAPLPATGDAVGFADFAEETATRDMLAAAPATSAEPAAATPPARTVPGPPSPMPPPGSASGPPRMPPPDRRPSESERVLELTLFEAEESLARGDADKALVLSSKAVKDRPDSLTARALLDRARREVLRGRRREKLDARVEEAERLLEGGDMPGAEKIVISALKLIPDHALALGLFGRLKEMRLQPGGVEAETERELARLTQARARKALDEARAALASGWEPRALFALRRGLRLAPDDPDLLALLRDVQRAAERLEMERARRRALLAQVRAGLDLLQEGRLPESLQILRAVLREDPDNVRAQAAIQEVRKAWLRWMTSGPVERNVTPPAAGPLAAPARPRAAPAAAIPSASGASRKAIAPGAAAPPAERESSGRGSRKAATPLPPLSAAAARAIEQARATAVAAAREVAPAPREAVATAPAPEIAVLRPSGLASWPVVPVAGALIALLALGYVTLGRSRETPAAGPSPALTARATPSMPLRSFSPPPSPIEPPGPLTGIDPSLRRAIEQVLAAYGAALEGADAKALARARPDLSDSARQKLVEPFVGALNAATDLRVLDVVQHGERVEVPILRTDVIVGGNSQARPPVEETLRFERRNGEWVLR